MKVGLLDVLGDDVRRWFVQTARRRRFARNEVVFHEGDPGDTLHVITQGSVTVRVTTPMGAVASLAVLGVGEAFGELAVVDPDARRSATVVTREPSSTLSLHRDDFEVLRGDHPEVDRFLVEVLAHQVRRLTGQVVEALFDPVEARVLRRVLSLAPAVGPEDGDPVELRVTQEELAAMAGTTRPTANRVLRAAVDDGVIELARGRIRVLDIDALRRRSN